VFPNSLSDILVQLEGRNKVALKRLSWSLLRLSVKIVRGNERLISPIAIEAQVGAEQHMHNQRRFAFDRANPVSIGGLT
jgi:hypothetical protein